MDSIFGIVGKDFVIVAADAKVVRSILVYKDDEDKVRLSVFFFSIGIPAALKRSPHERSGG